MSVLSYTLNMWLDSVSGQWLQNWWDLYAGLPTHLYSKLFIAFVLSLSPVTFTSTDGGREFSPNSWVKHMSVCVLSKAWTNWVTLVTVSWMMKILFMYLTGFQHFVLSLSYKKVGVQSSWWRIRSKTYTLPLCAHNHRKNISHLLYTPVGVLRDILLMVLHSYAVL